MQSNISTMPLSAATAPTTKNQSKTEEILMAPNTVKPLTNNTQNLPTDKLLVDAMYQRSLNKDRVTRIVKSFNPRQFGYLKVSYRDGQYYVIDGQHRLAAAKILGYTTLPCNVCDGLTQQAEADDFRVQQDNMSRIHTRDQFRAAIAAEDDESVRIAKAVSEYGFKLPGTGVSAKSVDCINSIGTLQRIVRGSADGLKILDLTLRLVRMTWGGQNKSAHGFVLSGTAAFVKRFVNKDFNYENFTKQLSGELVTIVANYESEKYDHHIQSENRLDKLFSNLLAKQYNKGLASRSKQRLIWEEN
jgi:hypothetical protein